MQYASTKWTTPAASNGEHGLVSTLTTLWRTIARRYRQRRTITVLEGLDDRTLKDIGLYRSEIQSVVLTCGAGRRMTCTNHS